MLVSVVVPCYGVRMEWLRATVDSINEQSIAPGLEVLFILDGATPQDPPEAHLRAVGSRLDRVASVRWHRHWRNRGLAAARNTGAMLARGAYLIFLDPDDHMDPLALEKMLMLLQAFERRPGNRVGYIYPAVVHFGDSTVLSVERVRYESRHLSQGNFVPSFALLSRQLYLGVGGMCEDRIRFFEDYDFWLRLASLGIHGHLLDEPLFYYRRHPGGRSQVIRSKESDWRAELEEANPIAFGRLLRTPDLADDDDDDDTGRGSESQSKKVGPCHRPLPPSWGGLAALTLWRWGLWEGRRRDRLAVPSAEARVGPTCDVMLIVPWLEVGGADYYDLDFVRTLRSAGLTPTIVVDVVDRHGENRLEGQFKAVAPQILHLATLLPPGHDQADIEQLLLGLYRRHRPRIVYIRNSMNGYQLARTLRRRGEQVSIWDVQHMGSLSGDTLGWEHTTMPYAVHLDHRILASYHLRDRMVERLQEAGYPAPPPDSLHVISPSVDTADRLYKVPPNSIASERHDTAPTTTIAFVGRMEEQKDPRLWVEVAEELASRDLQLLFLMVGEGYLLDSIKHRVAASSHLADRLLFLPFLDRSELAAILRSGLYRDDWGVLRTVQRPGGDLDPGRTLLLLTSENEGLPYVLLEALALGLAVVAPSVGAIKEVALRAPHHPISIAPQRSVPVLAHTVTQALATQSSPRRLPLPAEYTLASFQAKFRMLLDRTLHPGEGSEWAGDISRPVY